MTDDRNSLTLYDRINRLERLTESVDHPAELTRAEQRLVADDLRVATEQIGELQTPLEEACAEFTVQITEAFQPLIEFAEQFDVSPSEQRR